MRTSSRLVHRALPAAVLLAIALPAGAHAIQQEVRLLLDLDDDAGTGCTVSTVDGPFAGVEQVLITTVDTTSPPPAGTVTDVALSDCTDPGTDTFGIPASFDGGWPVGIDDGVGGRDVVETYAPLASLVVSQPKVIRLGVVVTDGSGGEQALLTVDDSPTGAPILLDLRSALEIPTLGPWGLALLALVLAALSVRLLGRRGTAALGVLLLFLAAGVAWAAGCVLDGQTDDWTPGDQLASDGQVLFGRGDGSRLCLRVDTDLVFNAPPVARPDAFTTDEDTVLTGVNVLADNGSGADSDPNLDPISVTSFDVTSAQGAAVTITSTGDLTYDPTGAAALQALPAGSSVDDTFTYTVEDPSGGSDTATVTVTVDGVNDAPTAVADTFETSEDTPLAIGAPGVLMNDADVDTGTTLTAVLDSGPSNAASFTLNSDGSFSYTPAVNFNGMDSFTYHASDGTASSATVTATITIVAVNDAPNAVDDSFMTDEDTPLSIAAPGVLMNDTDPEMDPLTVVTFDATSAQGATVSVAADGSFSYDPTGAPALQALGAAGSVDDTFTYTIEDPGLATDTATVTVHVTGVDDPPVAVDDPATVSEDPGGPVALDVLANDTDPDGGTKTVASVIQPTNGTVVITGGGTGLTYLPDANYCNEPPGTSTDDFTYKLNPGGSVGTVHVTVTCVNDAPTAGADSFDFIGNTELEVDQDTAATPEVLATTTSGTGVLDNDADTVEGDAIAITSLTVGTCTTSSAPLTCSDSSVGTVHLTADGKFSFRPAPGDTDATETFTYVVTDDGAPAPASATGTVTLHRVDRVWYVKNDTAAGGAGGSADPFDTLAEAETASATGDTIFVYAGDGTTTGQDQGITLKNAQKLIGEGVGLSVAVALNGNPSPTALLPAGNKPKITNTSGDGVTVADVTSVEIRGLDVAASAASIHVSTSGAGNAGVTITDNAIEGAGAQGIRLVQGSTGTTTADVHDNTIAAAGNGLDATTSAGTMELAFDTNTGITSSGAAGARVDGSAGGVLYVISFAGDQVAGATAANGLSFKGVVFDADPSTSAFTGDTVDAGTTVVGASGDRVSGSGVVLDSVLGDLSFSSLTVFNDGGTGLRVTGTSLFNAAAGSGFRISAPTGAIDTANGPAVDIDPATLAIALTSASCTASPGVGISLTSSAGTFSAASGSLATSGAGSGPTFEASGGSVTASYAGAVTSGTGHSVVVQNMTGGTVVLSGAVTDNGSGVSVTGNDAATSVTLSGTLTLTTKTHPAFTATGAGSLTVTDPSNSNSITTTTGTGVNISGVSIGASGVKFSSVNVGDGNAAAPNAADGILLTNVGSNPFTVTGGAIQNVTTRGLDVLGGSGNVSVGASISTTTAGRSVEVTGHTGGTVALSGAIDDNGLGVNLASNSGATINVTGSMTIDTVGANTGFNGASSGTLNVMTGTNDVDTSAGTGVAVNITDTTIGSNGITFRSVSANGATNGIVLTNTGSSGTFEVTGTGTTDGSGGTIQMTTGDAVTASNVRGGLTLRNMILGDSTATVGQAKDATDNIGGDGINLAGVDDVVLTNLRIARTNNQGIDGTDVTNFSISDSEILNAGDANGDSGISFEGVGSNNLDGTASVTNTIIDGAVEFGMRVQNSSGTLALTVSGSQFSGTSNTASLMFGEDGLQIEVLGTAQTTALIHGGCTFSKLESDGVMGTTSESSGAVLNITIDGNTFTGFDDGAPNMRSDNAVELNATGGTSAANAPSLRYTINGNTMNSSSNSAILVGANNFTHVDGRITGNVIAGSKFGYGIEAPLAADDNSVARLLVTGNTITNQNQPGAFFNTNNSATLDITFDNNSIPNRPSDTTAFENLTFETSGGSLCAAAAGNTVALGGADAFGSGVGADAVAMIQASSGTARLEVGGATLADPASTVLTTNNPGAASVFTAGTISVVANSTCQTPIVTPVP